MGENDLHKSLFLWKHMVIIDYIWCLVVSLDIRQVRGNSLVRTGYICESWRMAIHNAAWRTILEKIRYRLETFCNRLIWTRRIRILGSRNQWPLAFGATWAIEFWCRISLVLHSHTQVSRRENCSPTKRERNFFQHVPFFCSSAQSSKNTKTQGQKLKAFQNRISVKKFMVFKRIPSSLASYCIVSKALWTEMSPSGVTCTQSKKAKIKATKKVSYDFGTLRNRFYGSNIVHFDSFGAKVRLFDKLLLACIAVGHF